MTGQEFTRAYTSDFDLTRRFLLSREIGPARAEELAQAARSKAWERRGQLRELSRAAAWVNTIALNLLRADRRRAVLQVQLGDRDDPIRSAVERHLDAETVLGSLSDEDRRLMLLHVVAGLTSKEIAASASRLSAVAIRVRLHRSKVELRKLFKLTEPDPRERRTRHRHCLMARCTAGSSA